MQYLIVGFFLFKLHRAIFSLQLHQDPFSLDMIDDRTITYHTPQENCKLDRFQELPFEIRLIIWDLALEAIDPRIIAVFQKEIEAERRKELKIRHQMPPLLHVNQESRTLALKAYPKFLDIPGCVLKPKKDVVFMQDARVPNMYDDWMHHRELHGNPYEPKVERQVRFLAVGGTDTYTSMKNIKKIGYSNLEKLVLQKEEGGLTSEQEEYMEQTSWVRKPSNGPSGESHFVSNMPDKRLTIGFLTGQQMIREV